MKKCIAICLCLLTLFVNVAWAQAPTPQPKTEEVPDTFKKWEQENAPREAAEETRYGELWSKTLLLLIVMLLILFVGTWYMKRFGAVKGKDAAGDVRIKLLEKRVISPKAVVYLLSIDGHKIALSETSSGIQVLHEITQRPKPFSLEAPAAKESPLS